MELQQCWNSFLQAEQLLKQGHWSQAHYLLEDVLHYMPQHIHSAAHDEQTKPCQMACLITGLRDAAIAQSEIFNNIGQYQRAFDVLNQAYALLQFLSIEEIDSMRRLNTNPMPSERISAAPYQCLLLRAAQCRMAVGISTSGESTLLL